MYSVLRRTLSSALIALALVLSGMVFQAAAGEAQTASGEASAKAVIAVEPPADGDVSEPSSEIVAEEPQVQGAEAIAPQVEATAEPDAIDEIELVEIPDGQVLLAGGQEPSVSVRADRDVSALAIGDSLVLTCELSGFDGLEYAIRWQACVDGQWQDLPGENSDTLVVRITRENAGWAYRAAVDAQPV